ncbi:MAG: VOC family protein [Cyanobium sp.]
MPEPEATAITDSITSSLVLAADDPAALVQLYGALLHVEPLPGLSGTHWRVPWPAGGWLEVYAPSRSRPQPHQQGRLALCLQRQAEGTATFALLNNWITTALELGTSIKDPPRQEPFGAETWLLDPEDNRLLLLVLP